MMVGARAAGSPGRRESTRANQPIGEEADQGLALGGPALDTAPRSARIGEAAHQLGEPQPGGAALGGGGEGEHEAGDHRPRRSCGRGAEWRARCAGSGASAGSASSASAAVTSSGVAGIASRDGDARRGRRWPCSHTDISGTSPRHRQRRAGGGDDVGGADPGARSAQHQPPRSRR
jgi:hypothetical protein